MHEFLGDKLKLYPNHNTPMGTPPHLALPLMPHKGQPSCVDAPQSSLRSDTALSTRATNDWGPHLAPHPQPKDLGTKLFSKGDVRKRQEEEFLVGFRELFIY